MLTSVVENILNRGLPRSPRARQLCSELAGRRVVVQVRDIADFLIECDGTGIRVTHGGTENADARVSGGPLALLALAGPTGGTLRRSDVQLSGDAELAERFRELVRLLRPDLEEELALAIGDVPAHRIARLARAAFDWWRSTADTAVRNVAEYLAHESNDLVSRSEGRQLLTGIDAVRDDIDRLEARIEALAQRLPVEPPAPREP
ncbi:MAG TPA: SCP2 sterol-binding domain-containing protein [Steroidobacteraceae bacterium]|nr:SCP2 sterol-binding domain-containing protein [Steroidobacteraceae bacterium]